MKPGDLVKYRKMAESEEEERESRWDRIEDFRGIVLPGDPQEPRSHVRIMWNTGEIIIHLVPPYEEAHFEVIDDTR